MDANDVNRVKWKRVEQRDKFLIIIILTAGAHLAGYAGQYLRDRGLVLGRITGKFLVNYWPVLHDSCVSRTLLPYKNLWWSLYFYI